jgi:hypothetical protein
MDHIILQDIPVMNWKEKCKTGVVDETEVLLSNLPSRDSTKE